MTTRYIVTLADGSTVSTYHGDFLGAVYAGSPIVKVGPVGSPSVTRTYHIPLGSIVCIEEVEE